ncbi:hypothetical protein F4810DRAFT_138033 [Camillea tinctor]|nr:hypothetical protein F4810DRAFT_138033 [Camillea tinctor]
MLVIIFLGSSLLFSFLFVYYRVSFFILFSSTPRMTSSGFLGPKHSRLSLRRALKLTLPILPTYIPPSLTPFFLSLSFIGWATTGKGNDYGFSVRIRRMWMVIVFCFFLSTPFIDYLALALSDHFLPCMDWLDGCFGHVIYQRGMATLKNFLFSFSLFYCNN